MVVLDPGTPERQGRDGVWCDPCLAPLVKALNDGGVRTIASCCGHGKVYGSIALADGRWLTIMPDADWRAWDSRINETQEAARLREGGPFASGPFEQESPQDAAQAPQDGANGGDVGSGKGEGVSTPQTGAQAPGEGEA
jgi:hypothetical protein